MEILHKKLIEVDARTNKFIALCKRGEDEYCLFEAEISKISCLGMWMNSATNKVLRDDNPNLIFRSKEEIIAQLEHKILATREGIYSVILNNLNESTNHAANHRK